MRITKNTISKVYDPYFLSYSEKTKSSPPMTNIVFPPLEGFTVMGLNFYFDVLTCLRLSVGIDDDGLSYSLPLPSVHLHVAS